MLSPFPVLSLISACLAARLLRDLLRLLCFVNSSCSFFLLRANHFDPCSYLACGETQRIVATSHSARGYCSLSSLSIHSSGQGRQHRPGLKCGAECTCLESIIAVSCCALLPSDVPPQLIDPVECISYIEKPGLKSCACWATENVIRLP